MHLETVDAQTARFVLSEDSLPVGRVHSVQIPGAREAFTEAGAVWVLLDDTSSLRQQAPQIARWLSANLGDLDVEEDDEVVGLVAQNVLDSDLGAYFTSHGGRAELEGYDHDEVVVHLSGACEGCPAATLTLDGRIASALSRRLGRPMTVRRV